MALVREKAKEKEKGKERVSLVTTATGLVTLPQIAGKREKAKVSPKAKKHLVAAATHVAKLDT